VLQAALDERTRLEVEALTALQAKGVLQCDVTEGVIRSVFKVVQVRGDQSHVFKFTSCAKVHHLCL
jgi:hypothetical protein